jgi:hypothetical protein
VLDRLSSLVHLQHLMVKPSSNCIEGLSEATLPRMPHLTYLHVDGLSTENLTQLGLLTSLQELVLQVARDVSGDPLGPAFVGPSSVPGLVFPASLTKLELLCEVEPTLLSLLPAGLQDLNMGAVDGPVQGPGSLLYCMAALQQLTKLDVSRNQDWPPASLGYSAFTASSNLMSLGLAHYYLPAGVWPHVFPATRKLLQLTCLRFLDDWDDFLLLSAWGAVDVSCLVSCCPNLQRIENICLQHGRHVSELHKLTALTRLSVTYGAGEEGSFKESFQGLTSPTQVKDMFVGIESQELTMGALLPLTSLTALTAFYCCCWPHFPANPTSFNFQV